RSLDSESPVAPRTWSIQVDQQRRISWCVFEPLVKDPRKNICVISERCVIERTAAACCLHSQLRGYPGETANVPEIGRSVHSEHSHRLVVLGCHESEHDTQEGAHCAETDRPERSASPETGYSQSFEKEARSR